MSPSDSSTRLLLLVLGIACGLPGAGCISGKDYVNAQKELQLQQEQVRRLEQELAAEQATVRGVREQLTTARGLDADTLKMLVLPVRIELVSQSGGYDKDRKGGHDGIVLYVRPLDAEGHTCKAAGTFKVTLLDLAEPAQPVVIGVYEFDAPTTRSLWYGRFMTSHFTLHCPWPPSGPPAHNRVTANVQYTEMLTGQVFVAQGLYEVTLTGAPGAASVSPATRPG